MGCYLNPRGMSKEQFLGEHGRPVPMPTKPAEKGKWFVCLVDNGPFTAAAVLVNQREVDDFTRPNDYRRRAYYEVDHDVLAPEVQPSLPAN